jgi:hypothetical protein
LGNTNIILVKMTNKKILMWGEVTIRNGDKVIKAENHFVDAGLKSIISPFLFQNIGASKWYLPLNLWHIYIGSDTAVPTVTTHTELQSPIGAAPGTAPSSKIISVIHDGTPDGDWYLTYSAVWNPGVVPAVTLGEAALYMRNADKSTYLWSGAGYTPTETMTSRLSSADGDFGSIVIDDSKPLVIDWTIHFTFA